MENYLYAIFYDLILSIVTKKFSNKLSDQQRIDKAEEIIENLAKSNPYAVDMTQALIDKKGFNKVETDVIDGKPVFILKKEGMFHKVKCCYFITRNKDKIDESYLDSVYDELRRQALGENVFNSSDYKNG